MAYYIQIQNNQIVDCSTSLLKNGINIEVSKEIFDDCSKNKNKYQPNETLDGIELNPNYEEIKAQERREEFNKAFFKTSLGYIRREVSMKDGTTKTFLTDMLPQLVVGFPILAYEEPDFTQDVNVVDYQKQVMVTEEFLKECKDQLIVDFYGFNPME